MLKRVLFTLIFIAAVAPCSLARDNSNFNNIRNLIDSHQFTVAKRELLSFEKELDKFSDSLRSEYYFLLGVANFELYRFPDALLSMEKAKRYSEAVAPQSILHGDILLYLGLINKEGYFNTDLAREFYERAKAFFQKNGDEEKIASVNFQLARSFSFNEIDKREFYNLQARLFYEDDPNRYRQQLAECYNLEAVRLSYKNGFGEAAIAMYGKAISLSSQDGRKAFKLGKYYDNLGYSFRNVDFKKSLHYLRLGLRQNLFIPDNNYWIASSCNNLAAYFQEVHQVDSAEFYLRKVIAITISLYGKNHPELSNAYQHLAALQQPDSALFYYRKALFIDSDSDSIEQSHFRTFQGAFASQVLIYSFIVSNQSEFLFKKYKETQEIGYLMTALNNLSLMHDLILGKLTTIDWENSRTSYFKDLKEFYRQFIRLLFEAYRVDTSEKYAVQVLDVIEAIRYVSVMENKRESVFLNELGTVNEEVNDELSVRGRFAYYQTLLREVDDTIDKPLDNEIQKKFIEASRNYYAAKGKTENGNRQRSYERVSQLILKSKIQKDQAIVVYYDAGEKVYAIVVSLYGLILKELDLPLNFRELLEEFGDHFAQPPSPSSFRDSLSSFVNQSHDLYTALLKPFESQILNVNHLTIIPDGVLYRIPFEALVVSKDMANSFREADYLIRHVAIGRSLTVSQLFQSTENKLKTGKILAFASDLLPSAAKEVTSIANFFDVMKATESSCNVKTFVRELPNFDFIHLAVHGEADLSNPLRSRLIFNHEKGDTLFAYQLYSFDLRNKFIVLSACNSGLGSFSEGEGVFSISRAFFYAGAKELLLTLWSVADTQTSILVTFFYENLATGSQPDQALRKAKIAYLDKSDEYQSHPIFWAGLVIEGNTSPYNPSIFNAYYVFFGIALLITAILVVLWRRRITF